MNPHTVNSFPQLAVLQQSGPYSDVPLKVTIKTKTKIEFHAGQFKDSGDRKWNITCQSLDVGNMGCEIVDPIHDFSGLSADVLNDKGVPDFQAMVEKITTMRNATGLRKEPYMTNVNVQGFNDSVHSLFYNLLRGYYVSQLHDKMPSGDDICYNDGHVSLTFNQATGGVYLKGNPLKVFPSNSPQLQANYDTGTSNISDSAVILNCKGFTNEEVYAIIGALSKIDGTPGWPLAHDSPQLAKTVTIVGSFPEVQPSSELLDKALRTSSLTAAYKLATTHRYESQLDTALTMVSQVITAAMPVSAEGFWRIQHMGFMHLPEVRTTRGRWPELLTGSPGNRSKEVLDVPRQLITNPMLLRPLSMFYNAAAYNGLELFRQENVDVDSLSVHGTVLRGCGLARWAMCIAKATGTKARTPSVQQLGLITQPTITDENKKLDFHAISQLHGYKVIKEGNTTRLIAEQSLPQHPLLTVFQDNGPLKRWGIAGEVTGTFLSVEGIEDTWATVKTSEAGAAAAFLRVCGYDAVVSNGTLSKANWADNGLGMPAFPPFRNDKSIPTVYVSKVKRRENHFFDLPVNLRFDGTFKMTHSFMELHFGTPSEPLNMSGYRISLVASHDSDNRWYYEPAMVYPGIQAPADLDFQLAAQQRPVNPPAVLPLDGQDLQEGQQNEQEEVEDQSEQPNV